VTHKFQPEKAVIIKTKVDEIQRSAEDINGLFAKPAAQRDSTRNLIQQN